MTVKEYRDWMYNPDNQLNCDECPENLDTTNSQWKYPCGQQTCWVTVHCNRKEEEL
jgi:hypothetical protein